MGGACQVRVVLSSRPLRWAIAGLALLRRLVGYQTG
jgi:hypothetical protein